MFTLALLDYGSTLIEDICFLFGFKVRNGISLSMKPVGGSVKSGGGM